MVLLLTVFSVSNLEEMLKQHNHDFNERSREDKDEMSVEDKRLIKIAEESIKLKDGHYTLDLPFRKDDSVPTSRCIPSTKMDNELSLTELLPFKVSPST